MIDCLYLCAEAALRDLTGAAMPESAPESA